MIDAMRLAALAMIALAGLAVVRTREPFAQAASVSAYGLLLAIVFLLYQAPDVALSQIVVGAVALPLMILLALAKLRKIAEQRARGGR